MSFLNTILNIVFPANCICCSKSGTNLCRKCLSLFPESSRPSLEWIFPTYDYRYPPMKKTIWLFKYKNKKTFAKIFAESLYGRMIEELSDFTTFNNFENPILIPIPLSTKRMHERGFNQTLLICNELIKLDQDSSPTNNNFILEKNILVKIKDIEHQAHIENREKRIKNIINSFSVKNEQKIKDRNIILIDDVTTTGSTLNEARKTLKKAGAKKVIAFTIAH